MGTESGTGGLPGGRSEGTDGRNWGLTWRQEWKH